jgi:hypothetical protein
MSDAVLIKSLEVHYEKLRRQIFEKLSNNKQINVVVYEPTANTSKVTLIEALEEHELFNVTVVSHDDSSEAIQLYNKMNVHVLKGIGVYEVCLSPEVDADILFLDNPHKYFSFHEPSYDFYSSIPEDIFRKILLCYVPYAYICVNDEHSCSDHIHRYVWKFFVESMSHFKKANTFKNRVNNIVLTGHPYLDVYYTNYNVVPPLEHVVLWAPHHNITFYNNISLKEQDRVLRGLLERHKSLQIIFRPHPNLLGALDSSKHQNSQDYNTLLTYEEALDLKAFWENHNRVHCLYKGPITEGFERSTSIVTNCGGFQMEMLHSKRTVINLVQQDILSPQLRMFQSSNYTPNNVSEFESVMEKVISDNVAKVFNQEPLNRLLPQPGNAGKRIVNHLVRAIMENNI